MQTKNKRRKRAKQRYRLHRVRMEAIRRNTPLLVTIKWIANSLELKTGTWPSLTPEELLEMPI